jgi:hypothetical protein
MDVSLKVGCRVQDGMLYIEYSLENRGNRALLAYDGAPGVPPDVEYPDLDGQIYVSAVGDTVELKRINPPPLPGVNMNRVFVPPVSQVLPGSDRKVRFRLHLPLVERSQYTPDFPGAQYQERVAHNIQLWIEYFWKTESVELQPFAKNPGAFRVIGAHGEPRLASAGCTQEVSVKVRVDNKFQRV